ncbi:MAG: CoA activase [Deltaproteobacteria bacterium]|nr:CoA activase [Deltaproteobacteria bacterium]
MHLEQSTCWAGVDVGSVTVKVAAIDPASGELLHSEYTRHNARQAQTVREVLERAHAALPDRRFAVAVSGSGGDIIASAIGAFFVQEVVANSIAVRELYPRTRVAIELGGQDAKVVFFRQEESTGRLVASDMRMNGSCAGGTGAFIDQMAELLGVKTEQFGALAALGRHVYDISGRCGVFAKTDIQPLLNQCVAKEDIALSVFHAIAKQTIGGLVQGMEIRPPVIFEGGPLTFNPRLIEVFAERLELVGDDVIVPARPEIIVAHGTALAVGCMFGDRPSTYARSKLALLGRTDIGAGIKTGFHDDRFFADDAERAAFATRHARPELVRPHYPPGTRLPIFIGIDAGSTTSKFVLLDEREQLVDKFYASNQGDPLRVVQRALIALRDRWRQQGVELDVRGVGTTGYGEALFARAFRADYHTVETVAHAEAALKVRPDVSFILDIGGQDMKAIRIDDGVVTGITLNEACSAGCGSFVETFARSMEIPVDQIAERAFSSQSPSRLGSRCTVFMNSSVITEQKNGKNAADIMAGVTRSIVENVFTKVVRVPNFDTLGKVFFVQGGTFLNDAVLRALEQYTGRTVVRPPHPGEMGAIGIALLAKKHICEQGHAVDDLRGPVASPPRFASSTGAPVGATPAVASSMASDRVHRSSFIGLDQLEAFDYAKQPGLVCPFCTNNCSRTLITFNDGSQYVTGNRCERGEIIGDPHDEATRQKLRATNARLEAVPDLMKLRHRLLFQSYGPKLVRTETDAAGEGAPTGSPRRGRAWPTGPQKKQRIGIPRALEFFNSMPFWRTFFEALGYDVVLSRKSDYPLFESGLKSVPSDTICFPAKLAHGHVRDLIAKKVDRIFMPMMIKVPTENHSTSGVHVCAVVQGYPVIVNEADEPLAKHGIPFDYPAFHWYNDRLRDQQIVDHFTAAWGLPKRQIKAAIAEADVAMHNFGQQLFAAGAQVLESVKQGDNFAVVIACRPYHSDELVNHNISAHFTRLGVPVLTVDSLPGVDRIDLTRVRAETVNPFHVRMYSAAAFAAQHPNLELVQLVSFGCGHDAVITDEMQRIAREINDRQVLVLKLDEGEAIGPLSLRIKSFVETVRARRQRDRQRGQAHAPRELPAPFPVTFEKKDIPLKTILAPNLSRAFSEVISAVGRRVGFRIEPLPLADARAIELGKKYLHNDICFPAQINVGELLRLLEQGKFKPDEVVLGLAKNCDDCRAGQYAAVARKALDDAGYPQIPILTTGVDTKRMHPAFQMGQSEQIQVLWGLAIADAIDDMLLKTRPYERNPGDTQAVYDRTFKKILKGLEVDTKSGLRAFAAAVDEFNRIPVDRSARKPRVLVIGEILLNYHPSANGRVVDYLEANGMETMLPAMVDFFWRDLIRVRDGARRHQIPNPWLQALLAGITDRVFRHILKHTGRIVQKFRFYEPHKDVYDLSKNIEDFIDRTYMVGEGWLIPAEIIELAQHGVNSFVIVQPFGCLPNHITGRGLVKAMKKRVPHIQIVSLDYDPDTSFANVENRLQMLIMQAKEIERARAGRPALPVLPQIITAEPILATAAPPIERDEPLV